MRIFVVRHAHAGSRSEWDEADHHRPLSPQGLERSARIGEQLANQGISRLVSSPYVRCIQTLEPLATRSGLTVETSDTLAEGASPVSTVALVEDLIAEGVTAALCSHGDVIPELLAALARRGADLDPEGRCQKGSIWILTVADGVVTSGIYAGKGDLLMR